MSREDSSCTELPKMMVHMKVCEAHPFPIRHLTKVRVRLPLEVPGLSSKSGP